MKKEVILAIAIGFGLGLLITFGIWTANKSLKVAQLANPSPTPAASANISPTPAPSPSGPSLSLISPEDEFLTTSTSTTVSGKTTARATIVILYETGEQIIEADENGSFKTDVILESGYNTITVIAIDREGNTQTQTITVTHTTAKI